MTTIKDVAKYANVSVATVSRVLNQKGYVSKEAEKAVTSAIEALNYKPNAIARTLYHKTSGMIGLLVPDIANPFFPELARSIEDIALKKGYTVVLCNTDSELVKEQQYVRALQQKYVDGLILATGTGSYEHYQTLDMPVVALDRFISKDIPTVVSENKNGAKAATMHLIEKGCTFIAHLRGPKGLAPADDRYEGFKEVVEAKGIAHIIVETGFHIEKAEEVVQRLLKQHPTVDGIFASSDVTAAGAMKAAHTLKREIPSEIQIVGFDGILFGDMLVPSLTTVQQPIYEMGVRSVELLVQLIEKKTLLSYWHELPTTLKLRGTTKGGSLSVKT
ncbi:LacI family DNA-binding transcriptional regulator [Shouchella patagoniensis]|uniref:LacI family DNA-binding transcriptional regulator n=1 Tax=Shouchella patagoniensis TaxID=228576 RepID=UPI00099506D1|nr:LacI family DNA-binding transcriptional regulator [Shouchella patagoniensis]